LGELPSFCFFQKLQIATISRVKEKGRGASDCKLLVFEPIYVKEVLKEMLV
jgi:hypothetical protein